MIWTDRSQRRWGNIQGVGGVTIRDVAERGSVCVEIVG